MLSNSGKQIIIQSSVGSVFATTAEEELRKAIHEGQNAIAISGRVCNPGVYDMPENGTLADLIELAGGIVGKKKFKAAQFGLPFGGFIGEEALVKPLDFSLFNNHTSRNIIILSEEDLSLIHI